MQEFHEILLTSVPGPQHSYWVLVDTQYLQNRYWKLGHGNTARVTINREASCQLKAAEKQKRDISLHHQCMTVASTKVLHHLRK